MRGLPVPHLDRYIDVDGVVGAALNIKRGIFIYIQRLLFVKKRVAAVGGDDCNQRLFKRAVRRGRGVGAVGGAGINADRVAVCAVAAVDVDAKFDKWIVFLVRCHEAGDGVGRVQLHG